MREDAVDVIPVLFASTGGESSCWGSVVVLVRGEVETVSADVRDTAAEYDGMRCPELLAGVGVVLPVEMGKKFAGDCALELFSEAGAVAGEKPNTAAPMTAETIGGSAVAADCGEGCNS